MGSFDFMVFMAPWIVGLTVLILFAGINAEAIEGLAADMTATLQQIVVLAVTGIIFFAVISVTFIKPLNDGFSKAAAMVAEYPAKMIEKMLK